MKSYDTNRELKRTERLAKLISESPLKIGDFVEHDKTGISGHISGFTLSRKNTLAVIVDGYTWFAAQVWISPTPEEIEAHCVVFRAKKDAELAAVKWDKRNADGCGKGRKRKNRFNPY